MSSRRRRSAVLALGLWLLGIALLGATTVVIATDPRPGHAVDPAAVATLVFVLAFTTVGALVAAQRPGIPIGWLLLASGLGYALAGFGTTCQRLVDSPDSPYLYLQVLSGWMWGVSLALTAVYLLLRFPTGDLLSPRWRFVEWVTTVSLILFVVGVTVTPGRVEGTPYANPMGIAPPLGTTLSGLAGAFVLVLPAGIAALVSIGIRFRRSRGTERQQLKWIVSAAVLAAFVTVLTIPIGVVVKNPDTATNIQNVVTTMVVALLPVAIGIAVLRYRLWDIDRLINRTLVYAILTLLLVGVYAGLVVGLGAVTGRTGNPVLIAGSTLVVAALFGPARRRIQRLIDRRFFRRRYDTERVLAAFSMRLRDELDLESLSGELRVAVADAVQPDAVSVWIRGSR